MERMLKFWKESGEWSEKTFGPIEKRGPLGPMKHLVKEAKEIQELVDRAENPYQQVDEYPVNDFPSVDEIVEELVDIQHIIFDVARRLKLTYSQFLEACNAKLEINKTRVWPRSPNDSNEPVEHKR